MLGNDPRKRRPSHHNKDTFHFGENQKQENIRLDNIFQSTSSVPGFNPFFLHDFQYEWIIIFSLITHRKYKEGTQQLNKENPEETNKINFGWIYQKEGFVEKPSMQEVYIADGDLNPNESLQSKQSNNDTTTTQNSVNLVNWNKTHFLFDRLFLI